MAVIINITINIHIQVFVWMCVSVSFEYIARSGIAELDGNYV